MAWRFKRPKYAHFRHYCGECGRFRLIHIIGCAEIGTCPEFFRVGADRQSCPFFDSKRKK